MKSQILFLTIFCFGVTTGYGQWRHITAEEDTFVRAVEAKVNKILLAAAHKMPGKWDIKIETDQYQRFDLDEGQHHGRPHEVRISLYLDYRPSDPEMEQMDKEIFAHGERTPNYDPIPDELNRVTPEFRWHLYVSFVVNYYGFMPVFPADTPSLGYETATPGAFYSFVRWKQMGTGAPISYLYLGQFKRIPSKSGPKIVEDFPAVTNCRDAKTIILQVQSSERLIEKFIALLDMDAVNALIREH